MNLDGRYPENDRSVVTSGDSGFRGMAILVVIKRGFITREKCFVHIRKSIDWLAADIDTLWREVDMSWFTIRGRDV
jgi:hypothetical protein